MTFPLNIYGLAILGAFLTTFVSLPLWRRWSYRVGFVDDPGHRKIHDHPISLAGGLAVSTGLAAPLLLGAAILFGILPHLEGAAPAPASLWNLNLDSHTAGLLTYGFARRSQQLIAILFGTMAMGFLGWLDDKRELKPSVKFIGQLLIAALVAAAGVRITLFVHSLLFSYAITILWILAVTNAFNFMDNMNGLCAGLGAIGAFYFGLSAAFQGHYLVTLLAWSACGALLGFLPYNFPRATIFLGDSGSHLVGYLLGVLAILPHFYSRQNPRVWAVFSPLLILAVPLADLAWVVWLRWRAGQPVYLGDTNHLSHRLVQKGWTQTQAVLIIWSLAAAVGAAAFL